MLFTFGASCRPLHSEFFLTELSWTPTAESVDFQWDNRSGGIVYRAGQLKVIAGNEFIGILPAGTEMLLSLGVFERRMPEIPLCCGLPDWQLPTYRGPPAV